MFSKIKTVASLAGSNLLKFWKKNHTIELKSDLSPVTEVDKWMSHFLKQELIKVEDIPILSEEDLSPSFHQCSRYWLIDPLDGTKEFIKGEDDFAINIALIDHNYPVFSCIILPRFNQIFFAEVGKGTFLYENGKDYKMSPTKTANGVALISKSHHNPLENEFINDNAIKQAKPVGASLKFCRLLTGEGSIYARFDKLHAWDIAAGHLLVREAGYHIFDLITQNEPCYLNPLERLNPFIVLHPQYQLREMKIPCLN